MKKIRHIFLWGVAFIGLLLSGLYFMDRAVLDQARAECVGENSTFKVIKDRFRGLICYDPALVRKDVIILQHGNAKTSAFAIWPEGIIVPKRK